MRLPWTRIILALAALWLVVGGVLWWLNTRKPTAEKVVQFVQANSLEGKTAAERKAIIEKANLQID